VGEYMDIKQDIIKRLGPDVKVNKNLNGCYEYTFSRISAAVFRVSNIDIIGWHIGDLVCVAEDSRLFANEVGSTLPEDCKVVGSISGISDNPKQLFIIIPEHDNFDDRFALRDRGNR
jgi:hypothetical protein